MEIQLLVIHIQPPNLVDADKAAILGVKVKRRDPVVGQILGDAARGAVGGLGLVVVKRQVKGISAHDAV